MRSWFLIIHQSLQHTPFKVVLLLHCCAGWFSSCVPDAEDTRDGVKLVIKVRQTDRIGLWCVRGMHKLVGRAGNSSLKWKPRARLSTPAATEGASRRL